MYNYRCVYTYTQDCLFMFSFPYVDLTLKMKFSFFHLYFNNPQEREKDVYRYIFYHIDYILVKFEDILKSSQTNKLQKT